MPTRCAALFLFLSLILIGLASPSEAQIYCPLPEDGIWVNPNAKPKEITRIEIESSCHDGRVDSRIRAFTSCIPRDCKWGWTAAELRDGGGLQVALLGFLGGKVIRVRRFGDILDTHVLDVPYDRSLPRDEQVYNLQRK
ncbi:serine/threonine protein kinase [Roseibium sp.]|uniref:serine/threonine protein kinase n=1 Tax=Roseibium sp. TaxID=1936156 RepID=UPI003A97FA19